MAVEPSTVITVRQYRPEDHSQVTRIYVEGLMAADPNPEYRHLWEELLRKDLTNDLADIEGSHMAPGGNFFVAAAAKGGSDEMAGSSGCNANRTPWAKSDACISGEMSYIKPGGDPSGKEGVDYFLGEQALLLYSREGTHDVVDMLGDGDDDLNAPEGSDDTYCVLDSGTESEEMDLDDLDVSDADSSGSHTIDEEDDDMYVKEERHFADSFLNSIGGHDSVLAGDIIGPALKDLGTTGWHDPETPNVTQYLQAPYTPVPSSDEYPDLMGERGGPTEEALKRGVSPIALFFMFIPVALW
ncbi:hypothetical protein PInf_017361 [Phytophthora infestans]|nr:hypothetical protein PInf_017361 [Phytophthora infestans]